MNKRNIWIAFILLALILSACSPTTKTAGAASSGKASSAKLSTQTKIVLGTINLEETDHVVTAEQATQLLPMFYVLQELNSSKSAAQEEMDGLVDQIQAALTKDQLQAIDDMSLTMKDVAALAQGSSKGSTKGASTTSAGGGNAGGPPPDMGGVPGNQGGMPSTGTTSASSKSNKSTQIMDTKTPSVLFDTAIEILKKKVE